jgi:hypothetical protein
MNEILSGPMSSVTLCILAPCNQSITGHVDTRNA